MDVPEGWFATVPSKIDVARTVCVLSTLVDIHGGPVVNCAVVRMEGGIAKVDVLRFRR